MFKLMGKKIITIDIHKMPLSGSMRYPFFSVLFCTILQLKFQCLLNIPFFRFKWDIASFQPDFSIHPVEGYITPGMEVTFEVFFHPQEINQDIRYDVSSYSRTHGYKTFYMLNLTEHEISTFC